VRTGYLACVEVDGVLKDQGQLAPEVRRARETLLGTGTGRDRQAGRRGGCEEEERHGKAAVSWDVCKRSAGHCG
jgi:hypothetical protein